MADVNNLEELSDILVEITTVLAKEDEEMESMLTIADKIEELRRHFLAKEEKIQQRVTALQEEIRKKEEELAEIQSGPDSKELAEIESRISNTKISFQHAKKAVEEQEKKIETEKKERQTLLQVQEESQVKVRKELDLYNYVTNIRWDDSAPPEQIKGIVANKKNVKPIDLSSSENSKFFIINSVWDSIQGDE